MVKRMLAEMREGVQGKTCSLLPRIHALSTNQEHILDRLLGIEYMETTEPKRVNN